MNLTLPETPLERFFFWGVASQYVAFFLGLGPLLPLLVAWPLILAAGWMVLRDGRRPPWLVLLWAGCMTGILVEELSTVFLRGVGGASVMRWVVTFALAGFLPLAGGLIRPGVVGSAAALLGVQTVLYCLAGSLAVKLGHAPAYHSPLPPLRFLDTEYFVVRLIRREVEDAGEKRLIAFTPYATHAGAMACFYAVMSLLAPASWLKWAGIGGWVVLIQATRARMALIAVAVAMAAYVILGLPRRWVVLGCGVVLLAGAGLAGPLLELGDRAAGRINAARADSSQDRTNLRQIAFDDWRYGRHPLMGAGDSVPGGDIVTNVPIGTHDTVATTLYLRGAVGLGLLLLPIFVTGVWGLAGGLAPVQRVAASLVAAMLLYTYSQVLQDLFVYSWPMFVLMGAAFHRSPTGNLGRAPSLP